MSPRPTLPPLPHPPVSRHEPAEPEGPSLQPGPRRQDWKGAYVPYDILKEAFVAFLAVAVLVVLLAVVFSSPDTAAVTLKRWSLANPVDFAQTAITELDGTSATASYGPPYNSTPDAAQHIGFFEPAQWFGVHQPIDTAQDFVIYPLSTLVNQPTVQAALNLYEDAPPDSRPRGRRPTRRRSATPPMWADGSTCRPGATGRSAS